MRFIKKRVKIGGFLLLVALLVTAATPSAQGATITATSAINSSPGSLEQAMPQAQGAQSGEPGVWTKYSGNPVFSPAQSWEGSLIWAPCVIKDGFTFKMWYAGNWPSRIGYATSSDGITWTKLITNPVLTPGNPGDWDEEAVAQPCVLKSDGGYQMWFVGAMSGWTTRRIGYATSSDGVTWTKYDGNPVLHLGAPGSWEEIEVAAPWVLYDNGTYKMWYTGQDSVGRYAIGYAISSDGINWTKYSGNPVVSGDVGTWDENGVFGSRVLFDGTVYRMWYIGKDSSGIDRIGYATSPDGINWTKYSDNPVLDLGNNGAWDDDKVNWPTVILDGGVYKMWYLGEDGEGGFNFGYATAPEMHLVYLPLVTKNYPAARVGLVVAGIVNDRSFNQTAWKGVQDAMARLGVAGRYLESYSEADYEPNINEFIRRDYDLIITVGFLLGDVTKAAAEANPDQKFTIVDYVYDPPLPNVLGQTYATDEAAFLAGYLAAGMTSTGKVATFGAIDIPPIRAFMVGYEAGVDYYNQVHGTNVEVLGTDFFIGSFDIEDGRTAAESLFDQGADIILPVAGPAGLGSAEVAQERGLMLIGVDTDWYISAPEFKETYLTSVLKRMDVTVFNAIKAVIDGTFEGGTYVGTLANDGVGIAPFHDYEGEVSEELKAELEGVKQGIIDGTIDTGWPE